MSSAPCCLPTPPHSAQGRWGGPQVCPDCQPLSLSAPSCSSCPVCLVCSFLECVSVCLFISPSDVSVLASLGGAPGRSVICVSVCLSVLGFREKSSPDTFPPIRHPGRLFPALPGTFPTLPSPLASRGGT